MQEKPKILELCNNFLLILWLKNLFLGKYLVSTIAFTFSCFMYGVDNVWFSIVVCKAINVMQARNSALGGGNTYEPNSKSVKCMNRSSSMKREVLWDDIAAKKNGLMVVQSL